VDEEQRDERRHHQQGEEDGVQAPGGVEPGGAVDVVQDRETERGERGVLPKVRAFVQFMAGELTRSGVES
jgi:hypothetical protein